MGFANWQRGFTKDLTVRSTPDVRRQRLTSALSHWKSSRRICGNSLPRSSLRVTPDLRSHISSHPRGSRKAFYARSCKRSFKNFPPRHFPLVYFALYATTSPAVTWGGFGSKGARCSCTNSPATKVDCSSASLCSKTLVATITPSPASTNYAVPGVDKVVGHESRHLAD